MQGNVAIFVHSGDYDRVHQAFSIAVAAASAGRRAEVYLFWWALERVLEGAIDAPSFGPGREELAEDFSDRGLPTIRQLLEAARSTGLVRVVGCTGSLAILSRNPERAREQLDELVGWATILERTAGVTDRFYL